jgi:formate dehydrogenase subunit gamma
MSDTNTSKMIPVREKKSVYMHWFNAGIRLLLLLTGFGIISGELVRVVPAFWPEFMQGLFGGNDNLILTHSVLAMIWIGVFVLFILFNLTNIVLPFLKNVLVLTPSAAIRDVKSMVINLLQLFGLMKDVPIPPQGRYNGAQRLLGTMIIFCSLVLAFTGLYLFFGPQYLNFSENSLYGAIFRWSLVAHITSVFLVLTGVVAHIYFAIVEEPECMEAMKSGYIDVDFLKHHNKLWYDELKQEGKV